MKTIALTGAGGFLGREILRQGVLCGEFRWIAMTSGPKSADSGLIEYRPRDYGLSREFRERQIDCLINCAYPRNAVGNDVAEGLRYIERVLENTAQSHCASVINISSQSVYGAAREEMAREDTPLFLDSAYAVGKLATEMLTDHICGEIPHTSLRLASLIGPGFDQRIVNKLVGAVLDGKPITITRNRRRFGFLDVEDAAGTVLALCRTDPAEWEKVYTVGNGASYSLEDIFQAIRAVMSDCGEAVPDPTVTENEEAGTSAVSGEKLARLTGFYPQCTLRRSVEKIYRKKKEDRI